MAKKQEADFTSSVIACGSAGPMNRASPPGARDEKRSTQSDACCHVNKHGDQRMIERICDAISSHGCSGATPRPGGAKKKEQPRPLAETTQSPL